MNNPDLYRQCNTMTKIAAIQLLDEYADKLNWENNHSNIIDLGCGDGSVTNILKTYIPCNYKFVASDINEVMVNYAKNRNKDENTTFRVQDAGGDVPKDLRNEFNHVFSFFALHWIKDQEKAFRNIFNLLQEDGACLLSILGYTPIYHLFHSMGQTKKWGSTWLKNLDLFLSPYFDMQNIEENVTKTLTKIGFTDIQVTDKLMTYILPNGTELKNLIKAVEPYNMPEDVFEEFSQDCVKTAQEIGLLKTFSQNLGDYDKKIEYNYSLIVIHARKP